MQKTFFLPPKINESCDVLILDLSSLFVRSYCALNISNEQGEDVSGIVGTIQTIESQLKKHNPKIVVCVYDGKGGSKKKKKIYENYKAGRKLPIKVSAIYHERGFQDEKKRKENFLEQQRKVFDFISILPIHQVVIESYEADEVIAYINQQYFHEYQRIIVTGDKDFQQLISESCKIFHLHDKKLKDLDALEQAWGTRSGKIVTLLRCIDGDGSDNVPGIHGLGLKSIHKYFPTLASANLDTLDDFKTYLLEYQIQLNENPKLYKTALSKIEHLLYGFDKKTGEKCWSILERNYRLFQLFNVDIHRTAIEKIHNALKNSVSFSSQQFMKKAILEGIEFQSHRYSGWELNYKTLMSEMNNATKKLKDLIFID